MSEEIIKVLDNLGQKLGIAIDWSNQNIMPYLQELLGRFITLKNAEAITWIIISLIVMTLSIVSIILAKKWVKKNKYDSCDDEYMIAVIVYIVTISLSAIFLIILLCNLLGLLQNIFVPELSIIDYIRNI